MFNNKTKKLNSSKFSYAKFVLKDIKATLIDLNFTKMKVLLLFNYILSNLKIFAFDRTRTDTLYQHWFLKPGCLPIPSRRRFF